MILGCAPTILPNANCAQPGGRAAAAVRVGDTAAVPARRDPAVHPRARTRHPRRGQVPLLGDPPPAQTQRPRGPHLQIQAQDAVPLRADDEVLRRNIFDFAKIFSCLSIYLKIFQRLKIGRQTKTVCQELHRTIRREIRAGKF